MRSLPQWAAGLLAALMSGVMQALVFPRPALTYLCWVALAPLLLALVNPAYMDSPRMRARALHGFWLGTVSGATLIVASSPWLVTLMGHYGGLSTPLAAGVLSLAALYLGAFQGLFGMLVAMLARPAADGAANLRALALAPFFWVAAEWARGYLTGFPWDTPGTALVDNIPLASIAALTGVHGLSFLIALMNAAFAFALLARSHSTRGMALILAAIVVLQSGIFVHPDRILATHTALLVQPDIPITDAPWSRPQLEQTLDETAKLSVFPARPQPENFRLIVWPENPAPFYNTDAAVHTALSDVARLQQAYVVAGIVGVERGSGAAPSDVAMLNRAQLVDHYGSWTTYYDKIHLVPFGEYVPYRRLLSFAEALTREVGDFTPGRQRVLLPAGKHRLGVFICFESLFPGEVRQFTRDGADLLITLSNDSWYADAAVPEQHLAAVRMRAIENRRWVLRATNGGITASIDPLGRVVARAPEHRKLAFPAPYAFSSDTTFYARHGNWFVVLCAIISIVGILLPQRRPS